MLMDIRMILLVCIFSYAMIFSACENNTDRDLSKVNTHNIQAQPANRCFTIEPVYNNSSIEECGELNFDYGDMNFFIKKIASNRATINIDKATAYLTNYHTQQQINVNYDCFKYLDRPDSSFLAEILLSSNKTPGSVGHVTFRKVLHKKIIGYGDALVYEYRFDGVSEVSYHFMDIFFKDALNENYSDYSGYVICSNGEMQWKEVNDSLGVLPIFVDHITWDKEYAVPLLFDGKRFIPTSHFKIGNW